MYIVTKQQYRYDYVQTGKFRKEHPHKLIGPKQQAIEDLEKNWLKDGFLS